MPTHDAESEVFALAHAGDPQAIAPLLNRVTASAAQWLNAPVGLPMIM